MAGVSLRGKRYRFWYVGEDGRTRWGTGTADKKRTQELADQLEYQARLVREGLVESGSRERQAAATVPLAVHVAQWERYVLDRGAKPKHARHQTQAAARLLQAAGVETVGGFASDLLVAALGAMRKAQSPRTCNHALAAVKALWHWLVDTGRVKEMPPALNKLKAFSQEVDRRRVRRALTPDEFRRLIAATEAGPDRHVYGPTKSKVHKVPITGPARALLYRLAAGTGFRAAELRSLTRESFDLDATDRHGKPDPAVTVEAGYSKRKRTDRQPIRPDLAAALRPAVEATEPGAPVFVVPEKTAAMLRADLEAAGIPYEAAGKVSDFHALRGHYITGLWASGSDPVEVQKLARHSDIKLTTNTYTTIENDRLRKALGGGE